MVNSAGTAIRIMISDSPPVILQSSTKKKNPTQMVSESQKPNNSDKARDVGTSQNLKHTQSSISKKQTYISQVFHQQIGRCRPDNYCECIRLESQA